MVLKFLKISLIFSMFQSSLVISFSRGDKNGDLQEGDSTLGENYWRNPTCDSRNHGRLHSHGGVSNAARNYQRDARNNRCEDIHSVVGWRNRARPLLYRALQNFENLLKHVLFQYWDFDSRGCGSAECVPPHPVFQLHHLPCQCDLLSILFFYDLLRVWSRDKHEE